jgi:hypothetical protein
MKATVNLQVLKTTKFDSGALGPLAMVLHQFPNTGHYQAAITQRSGAVTTIDFEVNETSVVTQLNIDLAQTIRSATANPKDCDCNHEKQIAMVISPKGYVLFHASSGNGHSVTVSGSDSKIVFDSTKLDDGDLFAVSLLEPTGYSMKNMLGSAAGDISVSLKSDMTKRLKTLETQYIDVMEKRFEPGRIELTSSQGLVFRIKGAARIVIEKGSSLQAEKSKPILHWEKLQTVRK